MTTQDHNKVIAIMHLIYGGFNALMMLIMVPVFFLMGAAIRLDPNAPDEVKFIFGIFGILFLVFAVIFGLPSLIAGYGLLKKKSWARTAGIISAILTAISFPFGTALCVYTLWFLFGEGKTFYETPPAGAATSWGTLPNAQTFGWEAQGTSNQRQQQYAPPQQPPNWRDES